MDQKLDMYLKNTNTNSYRINGDADKHKKDLFDLLNTFYLS